MMIKKGLMIMSEMLMPFEKQEYLERLKKVKKSMAEKGIDWEDIIQEMAER